MKSHRVSIFCDIARKKFVCLQQISSTAFMPLRATNFIERSFYSIARNKFHRVSTFCKIARDEIRHFLSVKSLLWNEFYSHENKKHFHINSLALKQRLVATRNRPISSYVYLLRHFAQAIRVSATLFNTALNKFDHVSSFCNCIQLLQHCAQEIFIVCLPSTTLHASFIAQILKTGRNKSLSLPLYIIAHNKISVVSTFCNIARYSFSNSN